MDRVLIANEGMTYTNGNTFSKEVWLGVNDTAENWYEITDAEAEERKVSENVNIEG